ncbi:MULTISPECIES: hypothetical protein [unclassified Lebetimonas]|nr:MULTISPECIES: hypothetical protein [unclassified Lebetimonas]
MDSAKKVHLCDCGDKRFDFDYFVENFFSHPLPSSVDTIFFDENEKKLFLIEFKNQKCSQIDNDEIKKKILDSIEVLKSISKKNCNLKFNNYELYVGIVYNDEPQWKRGICKNTIQFGLEYLKEQHIVKDVKTNDIKWFQKEYFKIKNFVK